MLRAYKYRLLPNVTQQISLNKTFGCVRFFWNKCVETFNSYDKESNPKPTYKTSTELRNEKDFMLEVSAAAIQQKEIDFKEFKKQHFSTNRKKHIGRPSFKKRNDRQSFRLPNQKFSITENKIRLEKIGRVKFIRDRIIPEVAELRNATVSKDSCGNYWVSILVETEIKQFEKTNKTIGIDVGLKEFATLSDGTIINNPHYFRDSQTKLRKAQRRLSRKKKGSSRWKKSKRKVSRLHKKLANQREHFLHNLSTKIVKDYDTISIEDLNVAGMVKNRKLAKSISDVSWSRFFNMLKYKSEWYGKTLVVVGRFEPTSKTCSNCGNVKQELKLSERTYRCDSCGHEMDRDLNASININAIGVEIAKRA